MRSVDCAIDRKLTWVSEGGGGRNVSYSFVYI